MDDYEKIRLFGCRLNLKNEIAFLWEVRMLLDAGAVGKAQEILAKRTQTKQSLLNDMEEQEKVRNGNPKSNQ